MGSIETRLFINNQVSRISLPKRCLDPNLSPRKYVGSKSEKKIKIVNPYDQSLVAEAHRAGHEDVDDAVAAALAARDAWKTTAPKERTCLMHKLADLIERDSDKLAMLETQSMGAPLWITKHSAIAMAEWFRYYAGWTDKVGGDTFVDTGDGVCRMVVYEPLGVCAGIAAWNGTMLFLGWKMGPAIAAGNTYVYKVS